jgi:hypothetical protein
MSTNVTEVVLKSAQTAVVARFNVYELLAIAINFTYFLIGFPTNLLSIVVCLTALCEKYVTTRSGGGGGGGGGGGRSCSLNSTRNSNANNLQAKRQRAAHEEASLINRNQSEPPEFCGRLAAPDAISNQFRNSSPRLTASDETPKPKSNSQETLCDSLNHHNQHNGKRPAKPQPAQVKTPKANNPHRRVFELYLIQISVCDLIILGYNFIEVFLLVLSRYRLIEAKYEEIVLISKFTCRFVIALNRTVILVHNWLIAAMAATRCYAIYKPLNSNTHFSSQFYFRLNMSIVFALAAFFVSVNYYGVSLLSYARGELRFNETGLNETAGGQAQCNIASEVYEQHPRIDFYINLFLGIIGYSLPCLFTLLINLVLIYNVRHIELLKSTKYSNTFASSLQETASNHHNTHPHHSRVFVKATSSLLTLSFSYLICYIPYSVAYLLLSLDIVQMNGDVFFALSNLRALNHTLNFYIYFVTGKRFRSDVMKFLTFNKD